MFFSTGGPFSRRPRKADLGAARLGRRGIDRGPVGRESRPRPRPVARAARSQSRKNRVSFAGRPSVSAVPSRRRETRSAIEISLKKKVQSIPYIFPTKRDLLHEIRNVLSRKFSFAPRSRKTRGAGYTSVRDAGSAHDSARARWCISIVVQSKTPDGWIMMMLLQV